MSFRSAIEIEDATPWPHVVSIPIRQGVTVAISMPLNITRAEAEKVARVVSALAKK